MSNWWDSDDFSTRAAKRATRERHDTRTARRERKKITKKLQELRIVETGEPAAIGSKHAVTITDQVSRCAVEPPPSVRCADHHTCCLAAGHATPHRTVCGNRWTNRRKEE